MDSLIERLRCVRREALGLNRRNQEFLLRLNPARLVGLVDHKVHAKQVLARHGLPVPETFGCYTRQRDLERLAKESPVRRANSVMIFSTTDDVLGFIVSFSDPLPQSQMRGEG